MVQAGKDTMAYGKFYSDIKLSKFHISEWIFIKDGHVHSWLQLVLCPDLYLPATDERSGDNKTCYDTDVWYMYVG